MDRYISLVETGAASLKWLCPLDQYGLILYHFSPMHPFVQRDTHTAINLWRLLTSYDNRVLKSSGAADHPDQVNVTLTVHSRAD